MKHKQKLGLAAITIGLSGALLLGQDIIMSDGETASDQGVEGQGSMKSATPDVTPYIRPLVAEDF